MKPFLSRVFSGAPNRGSSGPSILVTMASGESRSTPLDSNRVSLGRNADNTLAFPEDSTLSRYHLAFYAENGRYFVEDLDSRNGTFVNGSAVKGRRDLAPGDVVLAGDLTITFQKPVSDEQSVSFTTGDDLSARITERSVLADLLVSRPADQRLEATETSGEGRALWAFMQAGRELASRRSLPELFSVTLDLSLEAVGAKRGALLTLDEAGRLVVQTSKGGHLQVSSRLKGPVLKDKTSLLVNDARTLTGHHTVLSQGVHSLMVVPLQTEGRVIGMIYLDSVDVDRRFTKADLDLITVMANIATIQIERERWEMQRQFLVSENVERLRRLAAAVSHEFNTPLGALKSTIDSLLKAAARGSPASPEKKARMAAIQADMKKSLDAALERMEQVIGRIQRFTNLDGGDVQNVDVNDVLADVVALAADPTLEIQLVTEPLPLLRCDRQALSTSLLSLMGFAGEVSRRDGSSGQVEVSTHTTATGNEVRIVAHGSAWAPEAGQGLFDPSFQIADGRIAAGNWSLFTAQQVVQGMGGAIEASNHASGGLILTLRFPSR